MFLRRKIRVSLTEDQLIKRLVQCNCFPHKAKVSGNRFQVYISLNRYGSLVRIPSSLCGVYMKSGDNYLLQCSAKPAAGSYFLLAIATCAVLCGLVSVICGVGSQGFVFVSLGLELVTCLSIIWQEQACLDRFEAKLKR